MIDFPNNEGVATELSNSFSKALISVEKYDFKMAVIESVHDFLHKLGYGKSEAKMLATYLTSGRLDKVMKNTSIMNMS